ncbi:MAG: NAD(P)H-hydrate dehydratase [Desulfovibrionaceae bacterium]
MFTPISTVEDAFAREKIAVEELGFSLEVLMENAGRESFLLLQKYFSSVNEKRIVIFIGSGNNGGDGIVLGRYLMVEGANVSVVYWKKSTSPTAVKHLAIAKKCGLHIVEFTDFSENVENTKIDIVIDALMGIGLQKTLSLEKKERIAYINSFTNSFIVSLDIPSGLCPNTGRPSPFAVRANITITFDRAKLGLYMSEAQEYVGILHISPIGIPSTLNSNKDTFQVISSAPLKNNIPKNLYKNKAGHVLIIGGSLTYPGAPYFAAKAAMRMGAGLVSLICPQSVFHRLSAFSPDNIMLSLKSDVWDETCIDTLVKILPKYDVVLIGNGMGNTKGTAAIVRALLAYKDRPPMVFDADALRAITLEPSCSLALKSTDVFTPHPGEMAALFSTEISVIQENRVLFAQKCCDAFKATFVIKGANSLISTFGKAITVAPYSVPNLSVAGSGDVLAGMIAAAMLIDKDPFDATCRAVYYHAHAGMLLEKTYPVRGNSPEEIIQAVSHVLQSLYS